MPFSLDRLETYGLHAATPALSGIPGLVAAACDAPTALVALIDADRLRFVAGVGDVGAHVQREGSYADWVVEHRVALVVTDGREDPRFRDHPRVASGDAVAFAGVPLVGRDGLPLGVLCAVDRVARDFSDGELGALRTLADTVVTTLELGRIDRTLGVPSDITFQGGRLRRALEQDELVTWFQPVVDLSTGTPWALEALIRWQHPQRGLLLPADFLHAVDHAGLTLPVGRHVLHQSLRAMADLRSRASVPDLLLVAVNVSQHQLSQPGLAASVLADLEAHRISPAQLSVEVNEASVLRHRDVVVAELQQLREAGVHIALDDYGTGRASLRRLLELPFTGLKLDECLTRGVVDDTRIRSVVRSTLQMADDLGITVLAEGVETDEQRAALVELGCTLGQGHAFAPAVSPGELPALLSRLTPQQPVSVRTRAAEHSMVRPSEGPDLLEAVLRGTRPVVLIASVENRVSLERTLAIRGVSAVKRPGYAVVRADEVLDQIRLGVGIDVEAFRRVVVPLVPRGATVWSDLAGLLWARGEVTAAIELEDLLGQLPATVHCCHEPWAMAAHGTPQEVRRLQDQHPSTAPLAVPTGDRAAIRPAALELLDQMLAEGASPHSVAARLNAEGHPTPWGARWHWRQVTRLAR